MCVIGMLGGGSAARCGEPVGGTASSSDIGLSGRAESLIDREGCLRKLAIADVKGEGGCGTLPVRLRRTPSI